MKNPKKLISRKKFLHLSAFGIAGIFLSKLTTLTPKPTQQPTKLKEALFYHRSDKLAG